MFAVDHILVSDDLPDAECACSLGACPGACCVQGDMGAPLEADELPILEEILPAVRHLLRPEALEVIEREGVWEETAPDQYATTCVDGAEWVFVTYDVPVAMCAIQEVQRRCQIGFQQPLI